MCGRSGHAWSEQDLGRVDITPGTSATTAVTSSGPSSSLICFSWTLGPFGARCCCQHFRRGPTVLQSHFPLQSMRRLHQPCCLRAWQGGSRRRRANEFTLASWGANFSASPDALIFRSPRCIIAVAREITISSNYDGWLSGNFCAAPAGCSPVESATEAYSDSSSSSALVACRRDHVSPRKASIGSAS